MSLSWPTPSEEHDELDVLDPLSLDDDVVEEADVDLVNFLALDLVADLAVDFVFDL